MLKMRPVLAGLGALSLAACVAPETPEVRVNRPPPTVQAAPPASQAPLEDAPVPNRRVRRGTDDQIIRLGR